MIMVLDASAAVEITIGGAKASAVSAKLMEADWIIAPGLFVAEVANAYWKYHQFADVPLDQCQQAMERAVALTDDFVAEEELFKEAFGLACITGKPVYDMMYLVLARRNNAVLLTVDEGLKKVAQKQSIRVA